VAAVAAAPVAAAPTDVAVGVAILVDEPIWWFKGRRWCHMVSDISLDELHAFAAELGIPRRGFQGDHYDIPEQLRPEALALGAREVSGRELLRSLQQAGLRLSPAERRVHFGAVRYPEVPDASA
jgi:hypothetical protein